LQQQIELERKEADLIFTEDDLNMENFENIEDQKIPVDADQVLKYKKKFGLLNKVDNIHAMKEIIDKGAQKVVRRNIENENKGKTEEKNLVIDEEAMKEINRVKNNFKNSILNRKSFFKKKNKYFVTFLQKRVNISYFKISFSTPLL